MGKALEVLVKRDFLLNEFKRVFYLSSRSCS